MQGLKFRVDLGYPLGCMPWFGDVLNHPGGSRTAYIAAMLGSIFQGYP